MNLLRDISYAARETHMGYDRVNQKLYEKDEKYFIIVITYSKSGKTKYENKTFITKEQADEIINMKIIKDSFHGCVMGNPIRELKIK